MTDSLYSRLYRFRERPGRNSLEDFLSEALCHLLNHLPVSDMLRLVAETMIPVDARTEWADEVSNVGQLSWVTQKVITYENRAGRLDLLLQSATHGPLMIVENKIGSGVRSYGRLTDPDDAGPELIDADQLNLYGRWLASQLRVPTGAITLLTSGTRAPSGFGQGAIKYGVRLQYVCPWQRLSRSLDRLGERLGPSTLAGTLANELVLFLGENQMGAASFNTADLAPIASSLRVAGQLDQTFREIRDELQRGQNAQGYRWESVFRNQVCYDSTSGAVWDWLYLRPPFSPASWKVWFVAWGILFPEFERWREIREKFNGDLGLFVCCGSEGNPLIPFIQNRNLWPDGWLLSDDNHLFRLRALDTFTNDEDDRTVEMSGWIRESVESLHPLLIAAAGSQ